MRKQYVLFLIHIFFIFFYSYSSPIHSFENPYFLESPRALLMGHSYTSICDDEYTLFYNPAVLGRHSGLSVNLINPELNVTNVVNELDRFSNFPSDPSEIPERILGLPLHLRLSAAPGLKMGQFGMNLVALGHTNIILKNTVHPSLDIDYRVDRGWIMGYAFKFGRLNRGKGRLRNKFAGGSQGSIGFAVKNYNRQGINKNYDLFGLELLKKFADNQADIENLKESLGYSYGAGWGGDLGFDYVYSTTITQIAASVSILDVYDTRFEKSKGEGAVPKIPMLINSGVSFSQNLFLIDYTFSLDISPLNRSLPFGRMLHFGAEVNFPIIGILAGYNSGYLSYGVKISLWPIKIYAGLYGVEIGKGYLEQEASRGVVYLSLFDISFDS
jgi:hypothetical protein